MSSTTAISHRFVTVEGLQIFYREAGDPTRPTLLLHCFPTSSVMFRDLMPRLAERFHVVASDLPGFGFSDMPDRHAFSYTFDNLTRVVSAFTERVGLTCFVMYVFDYGAPVGFRLAPETYTLDHLLLSRPGAHDIQLDLILDYRSNVALYPSFQAYFRAHQPPILATWGRNDPFFTPAGAVAFQRDVPGTRLRLFDTGHFALETHGAEIALEIDRFMDTVAAP